MEKTGLRHPKIQKQLKHLLFVLFIVSAVNAAFLWKTLDKLFDSYQSVARGQKLSALVGSLGQQLYEESLLRDTSAGTEDSRSERLGELRREIKNNFKNAFDLTNHDKKKTSKLKDIQNEWMLAKDFYANAQVLILVNSFLKTEQQSLRPLDEDVKKSKQAATAFIAFYLMLIASALFILSQYVRQRVFSPLSRLSNEMLHFEASHYQMPSRPIKDDEVGYLESKFHEMAERIASTVDELKALDKIKTDFLSLTSHELRTPMTSVKGALSLVLTDTDKKLDPETKQLLQISEKEADRLIRLINDILDLTKIEARKMPLNKNWINLNALLKTSIEGVQGMANMTKVKLVAEENPQECEVLGDKDRLQQVLTNLLSNAIKFSPANSSVETGFILNNNNTVTIYVTDHGPGIKSEDHSFVFEKFRSSDPIKSKTIKGTGLGLPICKALVEEHGGKIGIQSDEGEGCTFYFTLPEVKVLSEKQIEAA